MSVLPLEGIRVLEVGDGRYGHCGQWLGRLGAEVLLVEPPEGLAQRAAQPVVCGIGLPFLTSQADKRSARLDISTPDGREWLRRQMRQADIIILGPQPAEGVDPHHVASLYPSAVVLSLTPFGLSGPYKDYRADNAAMMALGGVLARSGIAGREPLLPPGDISAAALGAQAALVALLMLHRVARGGQGGLLDASVFEATVQAIDPGMGVTGSAGGGRSALEMAPRGRPPVGTAYPFFRCADGYVRICVLNPRQWAGMRDWLGSDHPFTDPRYSDLATRFKEARAINALIAALFADQQREELVHQGQRRGIPIAAVATVADVFHDEQFAARGVFADITLAAAGCGALPVSCFSIDGVPVATRWYPSDPTASEPLSEWGERNEPLWSSTAPADSRRPLEGLRVLDLGVIVAGAELGRLLADQGAEVIKIESREYPDGLRQTLRGESMSVSFAQGSRGKYSLGLNLRREEGLALFRRLVVDADVVLSNFKPGTMESLGIGYKELSALNPRLIYAESSALGDTGPKSRSMGYGPLVRASTGLSWLWRYPDENDSFSDATTIFPDHLAARVSAICVASLLLRRLRTAKGGRIALSQAEVLLGVLATEFLQASLCPGSVAPAGNRGGFDAPVNLFPCAGDDEWCFVSVDGDASWLSLCTEMGRADLLDDTRFANAAGRLAHAAELEAALCDWTKRHEATEVMERLQRCGVIAARMQRLDEYPANPHFAARGFFKSLHQPGLDAPMLTESWAVSSEQLTAPDIRPAPVFGQHTRVLAERVLGLSDAEIDALIERGVLQ